MLRTEIKSHFRDAVSQRMSDKYSSFSTLAEIEVDNRDYCVRLQERSGTVVVVAPHGGGIEPGTSEIAEAIAGDDLSFCAFEGLKPRGNRDLHITSTRFDEPQCTGLVTTSPWAIAVHGEDSKKDVVYLGGLYLEMCGRVRDALSARRFTVKTHSNPGLQGLAPANICNRGKRGRGVQLELSEGFRLSLFESLSRVGRQTKTERFHEFVAAVGKAIRQKGSLTDLVGEAW